MNFPQIAQQVIDKLGGKEKTSPQQHIVQRVYVLC